MNNLRFMFLLRSIDKLALYTPVPGKPKRRTDSARRYFLIKTLFCVFDDQLGSSKTHHVIVVGVIGGYNIELQPDLEAA